MKFLFSSMFPDFWLNSSLEKQKQNPNLQKNILKDTDVVELFPQEILGFCYCTLCIMLGLF